MKRNQPDDPGSGEISDAVRTWPDWKLARASFRELPAHWRIGLALLAAVTLCGLAASCLAGA